MYVFQQALGCTWGDTICDALVQLGCYHHRDMKGWACSYTIRGLGTPLSYQALINLTPNLTYVRLAR